MQYLGEVKVHSCCAAKKIPVLSDWHIITFAQCTPFPCQRHCFNCIVDDYYPLVQAFTFLYDMLSLLVHILDFPVVNLLLKNSLYYVINCVELWTIVAATVMAG